MSRMRKTTAVLWCVEGAKKIYESRNNVRRHLSIGLEKVERGTIFWREDEQAIAETLIEDSQLLYFVQNAVGVVLIVDDEHPGWVGLF